MFKFVVKLRFTTVEILFSLAGYITSNSLLQYMCVSVHCLLAYMSDLAGECTFMNTHIFMHIEPLHCFSSV